MTARRLIAVLVVVGAALAAVVGARACGDDDDDDERPFALDGRPRYPDAEGVLSSASEDSVVVDGRRYRIKRDVQAFSTITLKAVPLIGRTNQYVQVGLIGGTAEWIAIYGAVARLPDKPLVTYYTGVVREIDDDRVIFKDGSVLKIGPNVRVPRSERTVVAEIDAQRKRVRSITVAAI